MNNGANPKSYINGFSTDLIQISLIGTRLTRFDKSLTEGVWKLNLVLEQLHSHQLPIKHAKLLTKETEYGAEH